MKTPEQILNSDLRNTLKGIIQKEIQHLPKILETLEPKDRLNVICKLMPYIFPKVEAVHSKDDEPITF